MVWRALFVCVLLPGGEGRRGGGAGKKGEGVKKRRALSLLPKYKMTAAASPSRPRVEWAPTAGDGACSVGGARVPDPPGFAARADAVRGKGGGVSLRASASP